MLLLFPLLGHIVPIQDDWAYCLPYVRGASVAGEFVRRLHGDFYRPLDILGTSLVDPITLDGRRTAVLHGIAFLLLLALLRVAIGRLGRRVPLLAGAETVFWMVTIWLVIQSAAAVCLWQLDTGSQVWSAAAGVAFGLAVWSWIDGIDEGRSGLTGVAGILALEVLGLLTKEVFLGWCASVVLVLGLLAGDAVRRGAARRAGSLAGLAAAVSGVAIGYVVLRRVLGGLVVGYGKYSGNALVNSAKNVVVALAGGLTVGPIHALRDPQAFPFVRPLVFAGIAAAVVLLVAGLAALVRIERERRGAGWLVALVAFVAAGSIVAVMSTDHLSEVYLLGPNIGFGLLVALGTLELLRRQHALATLVLVVVLATGAFGTWGRLRQFATSWHDARALQGEARALVAALPATDLRVFVVPGEVLTAPGYVHSTYEIPPGLLMPPVALRGWLERSFPGRLVEIGEPPAAADRRVVQLTGRGTGTRPRY